NFDGVGCIFARPHRREEQTWVFETVLQCGPVASLDHPGIAEPMLVVRFPSGGALSVEFIDDAPDDDRPRPGAWLELRAEDPAALMRVVREAGLTKVKHPGHTYYSWRRVVRSSRSRRSADHTVASSAALVRRPEERSDDEIA